MVITDGNQSASKKKIFIWFIVPIWLLCIALIYETYTLSSLGENITKGFDNYKAEMRKIILRYEDQFTPAQVGSAKNNEFTAEIATAVTAVLNKIAGEL